MTVENDQLNEHMNEWVKNKIWLKGDRWLSTWGSHRKVLRWADDPCSQVWITPLPRTHSSLPISGFLWGYHRAVVRTWRKFRSPMSSWQEPSIIYSFNSWYMLEWRGRQGFIQTKICKSLALDVIFWIWTVRPLESEERHGRKHWRPYAESERRWQHYLKPGLVTLSVWGIGSQTWAPPRILWRLLEHTSWGFT